MTVSKLAVDIDTARKNLNSHDWVAVDMHDSLCKRCRGSILNVTLVFSCEELGGYCCDDCGNELCSCNDPDNRWQSSEYDNELSNDNNLA
jgi:hypothetical protein